MPHTSREVQLHRYPVGEIRAEDFRVVDVEIADPGPGEVLVRNTWTSVDPSLRLRLREHQPAGYFPAFPLDHALDGVLTVGEVVASRAEGFATGDAVSHASGWRELALVDSGSSALGPLGALTRLDTGVAAPQAYLGPLGGMGLTAYAGLFEVAGLKDGDVVWVSAAAGAVGSLAVQFAKLRGHRVIASAGSDEKVAHLVEELGADVAFNYRSAPVADLLRRAAPDGIDVYFDNVGGDHLEAALGALRPWGRVALCGAISEYESTEPVPGPTNLFQATVRNLTLRGFRGSAYTHLVPEVQRQVGAWLREGRIHYRESVRDGLEQAPDALVDMLAGRNLGKTLVRIPERAAVS